MPAQGSIDSLRSESFDGAAWALMTDRTFAIGDVNVVENWPFTVDKKLDLPVPNRTKALSMLNDAISELQHATAAESIYEMRHLTETPGDVVAAYLTEVVEHIKMDIESRRADEYWKQFPIDLVITHPAEWDYRANKAFSKVFFQDEAIPRTDLPCHRARGTCAGECFIVVDAGGGTVDLVSYRGDSVIPNFRVTKVTNATGAMCGASSIDQDFLKDFLPYSLGPEDYSRLTRQGDRPGQGNLNPHGASSRGENFMLERFTRIKHDFTGAEDAVLDLPDNVGLRDNPQMGVDNGQLRIRSADMQTMFEKSVHGTLSLIKSQMAQIHAKGLHPKVTANVIPAIFLSGGFSRSPYLKKKSASWSAVAKGAVLIGGGVDCLIPAEVTEAPEHVGIILATRFADYERTVSQRYADSFEPGSRVRPNIQWVVAKGDLVLHDQPILKRETIVRKLTSDGSRKGTLIVVRDSGDELDRLNGSRFQEGKLGQTVESLHYDLNDLEDKQMIITGQMQDLMREGVYRIVKVPEEPHQEYRCVEMEVEITIDFEVMHLILSCGRKVDSDTNTVTRQGAILIDQQWLL
ncbi:hypothetical protein PG984_004969 [Apiospora sp. TS-2023a]